MATVQVEPRPFASDEHLAVSGASSDLADNVELF
jgi:hypothetical protein